MKVIKLTEKDILNVAEKIIKEQQNIVPPYPEPSVEAKTNIAQIQDKVRKENHLGTPTEILDAKRSVNLNLHQALGSMKKLMILSGVNPETNNIVQDIEKVIAKFDNLYGQPKKKEEKLPKV